MSFDAVWLGSLDQSTSAPTPTCEEAGTQVRQVSPAPEDNSEVLFDYPHVTPYAQASKVQRASFSWSRAPRLGPDPPPSTEGYVRFRDELVNEFLNLHVTRQSIKACAITTVSIISVYFVSLSLTALNKVLFDLADFNYPILVTCIHFSSTAFLLTFLYFLTPLAEHRPTVTASQYCAFIFPVAVLNSLDVSLTNLAYASVSLSIITIVKSANVVMTYMFSVLIGLEQFSCKLCGVVLLIVASISLTISGMEVKNVLGLFFLGGAVISGALRWVMIHHQLQVGRRSPIQLMFLTQPTAAACLVLPAYLIDYKSLHESLLTGTKAIKIPTITFLIFIAVILAAILIFVEYSLVEQTSSLSFSIVGVGKEILTIVMSVVVFREHVRFKTYVGILISVIGIVLYSYIRLEITRDQPKLFIPPENSFSRGSYIKPSAAEPSAKTKPFVQRMRELVRRPSDPRDNIGKGYHPIDIDGV